jgi:hypothetical protein
MMYAVEMGSGAVIYILSFMIASGIQKLIRRDTQTHRQHGDRISLLSFFQTKESRLKRDFCYLLYKLLFHYVPYIIIPRN